MLRWRFPLAFLLYFLSAVNVAAQEVSVAVASNFSAPFQALAGVYSESSGHSVKISTGSSGKLFAQIQHGAPFDLFLSADTAKPEALVASGDALADSRFTYAVGQLALWNQQTGTDPRPILNTLAFRHLAIANPRLAPYGRAAQQTLQTLGLWQAVQDKLVTGENIAQTWQYVATGNADLGFVALSQIMHNGEVPAGAWVVPGNFHAPIRQDAVVLARAAEKASARALMEFLRSPEAAAIIRAYGYDRAN